MQTQAAKQLASSRRATDQQLALSFCLDELCDNVEAWRRFTLRVRQQSHHVMLAPRGESRGLLAQNLPRPLPLCASMISTMVRAPRRKKTTCPGTRDLTSRSCWPPCALRLPRRRLPTSPWKLSAFCIVGILRAAGGFHSKCEARVHAAPVYWRNPFTCLVDFDRTEASPPNYRAAVYSLVWLALDSTYVTSTPG